MIKVGVIGYGYSAQTFHMPILETSDKFVLSAVSSSKVDLVSGLYPVAAIFDNPSDLIHGSDVDCVVITAPNDVHAPIAKEALENGKHVIVEKPMATNSREADELVSIANEKSLIISVFQNRRWDGDFLTVKKLLAEGTLGEIRVFESRYDRFRPTVRQRWREKSGYGTGIWFDLGAHLADQAIHLFGLPSSITGRCLATREGSEVTDYAHVQLHYGELEVVLNAGSFSSGPTRRFLVDGTKGSYVKYGMDPQEEQLKAGVLPIDPSFGRSGHTTSGRIYQDGKETAVETEVGAYQHYYEAMAETIENGSPNPVSNRDSRDVMKILDLAEKSSRERRTLSFA